MFSDSYYYDSLAWS